MNLASWILKQAKITYQPHQKRIARRLDEGRGILAYHGLGSGKTLSAILAAEKHGGAVVVVPASLRENFKKEIEKAEAKGKYEIFSYEGFVNKKPDLTGKVLILDEAHRIRTSATKRSQLVRKAAKKAKKVLLLTATPIQNKPHELAPVINTLTGESTLPLSEGDFKKTYLKKIKLPPKGFLDLMSQTFMGKKPMTEMQIHNRDQLKKKVKGLIDYHKLMDSDHFPSAKEHRVRVTMDDEQTKIYDALEKQMLPKKLRDSIKEGRPPDKQDVGKLNAFSTAVRQITNAGGSPYTKDYRRVPPKVSNIANRVVKAKGPSLIYSNYLKGGLEPVDGVLKQRGLRTAMYTGKLKDKEKKEIIKNYNAGKLDALLVSSSGGEGLDLKNTSQVHVMEPHWNDPKINQVIGRAIRYKSHSNLPQKDRHVDVFKYESRKPGSKLRRFFGSKKTYSTIDETLYNMSDRKSKLNKQFLDVLKEVALERKIQANSKNSQ